MNLSLVARSETVQKQSKFVAPQSLKKSPNEADFKKKELECNH
jgi:hypothetical protein